MAPAKKRTSKPAKTSAKTAAKRAPVKGRVGAPAPPAPGAPLIGQVEIFAFPFVPAGWLPCDGRLLQIAYYQPLFSLLGTSYGGDGRISFALPKMSVPNSQGQHYCIAVQGAYPSR